MWAGREADEDCINEEVIAMGHWGAAPLGASERPFST